MTTGSVRGRVSVAGNSQTTPAGQVTAVHVGTGRRIATTLSDGRFYITGIEPGTNYYILVRSVGFKPAGVKEIVVQLGEERRIDITLHPASSLLDTVWVNAEHGSADRTFGQQTFSQGDLRRIPSLDRDFYDFVRLSPFASTRSPKTGLSIAGSSTRYNNFLLDGVSDRGLLGNFSAGTGQGAKPVSLEAVKEYQLLVSPFDASVGDFIGGLVNAVTRSGQNTVEGSAFAFARGDGLARRNAFVKRSPYERHQYGLAVGGPIIRQSVHYFIAAEQQRLTSPARGPFAGGQAAPPVRTQDIIAFTEILSAQGLTGGSDGPVELQNPARNLFVRLDVSLTKQRSRAVVWHNFADAVNETFTREASTSFFTRGATTFPLSTLALKAKARKAVSAGQLFSRFSNAVSNELTVAIKAQPNATLPSLRSPLVSVAVPSAAGPGIAYLEAGSAEAGHGISTRQRSVEAANAVTVNQSFGVLTVGIRMERLEVSGQGQPGAYGSWLFSSLDSLKRGIAQQYRLVRRPRDAGPTRGSQVALFGNQRFIVGSSLSLSAGIRAERLKMSSAPEYSRDIDSIYQRNTATGLPATISWSPRAGFEWTRNSTRMTGGVGVFSSRPPLGWLGQPLINTGTGSSTVLCIGQQPNDPSAPSAFVPDYRLQPTACAGGLDTRTLSGGPVNIGSGGGLLARALRAALGITRELHPGVTASIDWMMTRNLNDFAFVNVNLADTELPAGLERSDRNGRILYGSLDASLRGRPRLFSQRFSEVIALKNHSKNRSHQVVATLEIRSGEATGLSASYARSRAKDVLTPPSQFAFNENWQAGRVVSGRQDVLNATTSALEVPHRILLSGRHQIRWRRWATDVGLYYIGESGLPFTYIASAGQGRGDLNADGTNLNDPIYIPLSGLDTAEILFAGSDSEVASQQLAFQGFIEANPCVKRQRGTIMRRNSCRAPWTNVTAATVRQTLPLARRSVTVQLDIFNVLNLLHSGWGKARLVPTGQILPLLEHVGQTPESFEVSRSIFRFDSRSSKLSAENAESAFQLQLGVRYDF